MAAYDAVTDGESESHPADALRREERVEDARAHVLRHPLARVGDRDDDAAVALAGREPEHSAARHRVHGVEDHVHENVAQFGGVAEDGRARTVAEFEHDVDARGLGGVLPARARDLARIEKELIHRDGPEVVVFALAREVLYAPDGLRVKTRRGPRARRRTDRRGRPCKIAV